MGLNGDHRRELLAIIALSAGAFVGLSLLPVSLTGPLGQFLGTSFWRFLGMGSLMMPVLAVIVGAIGFRWLRGVDLLRVTILAAGLVILIPYWAALFSGVSSVAQFPADYADWGAKQRMVGIVPALLAIGATSLMGTAGAAILGVLAVSALTITTIGWHPFRRLVMAERHRAPATVVGVSTDGGSDVAVQPMLPGKKPKRRLLARPSAADGDPDEQAFITGQAVKPFPLGLLAEPSNASAAEDEAELDRLGGVLIDTLKTFRVDATLGAHRSTGPVVTQYEVAPAPGVKVGRIAALSDDLALKMEAQSIRIVAPIPGRAYVGVEVPNPTARIVTLRELLTPPAWDPQRRGLPIALGRDLEGRPIMADLTKMPHLLIAGATGSGKSVCINTIVTCLVSRYTEQELQLLMIDPKMVELTAYNALPHLIHPVVTNNKDAAKALKWTMIEMEERYELFSVNNVRNLHEFNRKVKEGKDVVMPGGEDDSDAAAESRGTPPKPQVVPYTGSTRPYVVVVVDELADLMMTVQGEVEKPLAILAQKARATGIHLVLATQRPSVNVITGLIKANFPSRIAFRVASKVDSRTILDQNGAEALLGNGDMLFLPPGKSEPVRLQGAFISTDETERVTEWYREQRERMAKRGGKADGSEESESQDILAVVREHRDANAQVERHLEFLADPRHRVADSLSSDQRSLAGRHAQQNEELISTPTKDQVRTARRLEEAPGHALKHAVAEQMAVSVVELLEVIQIAQQDRERLVLTVGPRHRGLEPFIEGLPIQQPGQRIMQRLLTVETPHGSEGGPGLDRIGAEQHRQQDEPNQGRRTADTAGARLDQH